MNAPKAQSACEECGCRLLLYQEGTLAAVQLPSSEEVLVSMGTSSIKVFRKRPILGWFISQFMWLLNLAPMGWISPLINCQFVTVLSLDLAPFGWVECVPVTRAIMSTGLVDAVMIMVIHARSISDMLQKYESSFDDFVASAMQTQMETLAQDEVD
jgi:hypothetical protein